MRERCQHCRALYFECESSRTGFALCCRDGKLKGLPCLPPAPEPLASLLRNQSPKAEAFKQNIRRYNAALAFASFANSRGAPDGGYDGQLHGQEGRSRGPPVYILHGQAYHTISTLYPGQGRDARYGQLYIYDPEEATQLRASAFEGLDVEILRELQAMLTKPVRTEGSLLPRNPYPAHYRSLHERVCAEETEASQRGEAPRQQVLRMTCASVPDPRRYNKPSSREVAVVFVGAGALPDKFVHIYPRRTSRSPTGEDAGDLQRLSYLSEHTDPLTYPLVHVAGTLGWSTNLLYCADHLAQNAKQLRISIAEFYAHRLMTRHLPSALVAELPHASGRLFQQFAVDAYAKLENSRLDWVMRNQGKLRMDTLRGLTDHVAGLDFVPGRPHEAPPETEAAPSILRALGVVRRSSQASSGAPSPHTLQPHRPSHAQAEMKNAGLGAPPLPVLPHRRLHGKRVVLPATFGGSPRDLHQCYLDAMAIVAKFGRPDFFITMTANPNWTEVIQNLKPGEKAADRPDLVARVFRAKLRELISDLTLKGVLGKAIAYTHVVEFQKRGLPHAHILVILRAADKPRTPADVDRLVCAEVPDKAVNPRLYHLVETFMVHGPCGALDPTCPCMTELGQCSKHFPKTPRCETELNVGGYPAYRRRQYFPSSGESGQKSERTIKNGELDSTWVVPYNPYLLTKFECHLNVEVCTSIRAVKYLYKYTYKGPDRACIEIGVDEVTDFLDSRYVGAPEACWRILEYPLHAKSHQVMRLPVHMPKEQNIVFRTGEESAAIAQALVRKTALEAWFELNGSLPVEHPTRQIRYGNMPSHYTWDAAACRWQPRHRGPRRGEAIGRMYNVKPSSGELYYLRLLLLHVPGMTSWDDFMQSAPRADGDPAPQSYREAARAHGLLHDDVESLEMLREAVELRHTSRDRQKTHELFAEALVWCDVADPVRLWGQYLALLSEQRDVHRDATYSGFSDQDLACEVYKVLDEVLQGYHMDPKTFGIQAPSPDVVDPRRAYREYASELRDASGQARERRLCDEMQLYPEQAAAFDAVCRSLDDTTHAGPNVFYIDGPGGTGKTYLYTKLLRYVRAGGRIALAVSMSGIAALLLDGGRTAHSRFRLPVPLPLDGVSCNVRPNSVLANLLRDAALIVWDEAPTTPKAALVAVDDLLRDLMGNMDAPFGGKTVVLGGDFRQIPPILRRVDEKALKSFTLRAMPWWGSRFMSHFALTRNMRAVDDADFAAFLEQLGDGTYAHSPVDVNGSPLHPRCVRLPDSITAPYSWTAGDLMEWVYGGYDTVEPASWSQFYEDRMVVTPLNSAAAELNAAMLQGLPSVGQRISLSHDQAVTDDVDHYTPEFLNALEPNGMPPHELQTCPGALMILLRNYSPRKGLCNGTRVVVRGQWRRLLQVQVVTGPARGNIELLPRIVCDSTGDNELPFVLRRLQFPLRPAWAISINKAQGQTVSGRMGIHLPTPVFAHGQLYVAVSRATLASNVRVVIADDDDRQRRVPLGGRGCGKAAAYTLNLVDQTLLRDGPTEACEAAAVQRCPAKAPLAAGVGSGDGVESAPEQAEQHRLATVLPDPLGSGFVRGPLAWDSPRTNSIPLAADEWAIAETGAPCGTSSSSSSAALLEELASGGGRIDVEYVSDAEDMGGPAVAVAPGAGSL